MKNRQTLGTVLWHWGKDVGTFWEPIPNARKNQVTTQLYVIFPVREVKCSVATFACRSQHETDGVLVGNLGTCSDMLSGLMDEILYPYDSLYSKRLGCWFYKSKHIPKCFLQEQTWRRFHRTIFKLRNYTLDWKVTFFVAKPSHVLLYDIGTWNKIPMYRWFQTFELWLVNLPLPDVHPREKRVS